MVTNGMKPLNIPKSREGAVRCWGFMRNDDKEDTGYTPRLSAAIMTPSLYLIARTLVPVTMGCLCKKLIQSRNK